MSPKLAKRFGLWRRHSALFHSAYDSSRVSFSFFLASCVEIGLGLLRVWRVCS